MAAQIPQPWHGAAAGPGGSSSGLQRDSSLQPAHSSTCFCKQAGPRHPSLRFFITSRSHAALQSISWLICVTAIKLLLLEVLSVVNRRRLG